MMSRRQLLATAVMATVWPYAARTQEKPQVMKRLAVLAGGNRSGSGNRGFGIFTAELAKLGWRDNQNLVIDARWAEGKDELLKSSATELVLSKPDVILTATQRAALAVATRTKTIPIVFINMLDPITAGLAATVARPGGNVTGFTGFEYTFTGKWLQLLKELGPETTRVLALLTNSLPNSALWLENLTSSASATNLEVEVAEIKSAAGLATAFANFSHASGAVLQLPDAFLTPYRDQMTSLAAHYKLPAIYADRFITQSGSLISYGPDLEDLWRRAPTYIVRILKGENSGDLPIQSPTKFKLVIDLRAAKRIDLTVPPSLLARADEVIE